MICAAGFHRVKYMHSDNNGLQRAFTLLQTANCKQASSFSIKLTENNGVNIDVRDQTISQFFWKLLRTHT